MNAQQKHDYEGGLDTLFLLLKQREMHRSTGSDNPLADCMLRFLVAELYYTMHG